MAYRFRRALIQAIQESPKSQTELGAPFDLLQCHISRMLHGETFGDVVRERVDRLGLSIGVAAASVPADLPDEDEALVDEFASFSVVFDRLNGVATIVDDATARHMTFPDFRAKFGERACKWLELPAEARRTYPSLADWHRANAKAGAR